MKNTYVAIMAGGIGSRFWPESRVNKPKQFLDILGTGESLIKMTFDRFAKVIPPENIMVVTNDQYVEQCKEHMPEMPHENIIAEPLRKNTAPCIAYVSYKLKEKNPYANLIVAPSDHLITKQDDFLKVVEEGIDFVSGGSSLLTLGIRPSRPDTGYGYIQYLESDSKDVPEAYRVKTFTEKPQLELAKQFVDSGDFLWNSGIFLWNVQTITESFRVHLPEIADLFEEAVGSYNTEAEKDIINRIYSQCPSVSIDYGIMEKASNVYVKPASFGWSDLGTWTSLWDMAERNENGNTIQGENIMSYDNKNTLIKAAGKRLVVVQGMEDCIIVDTDDSLLVCKANNEAKIKQINKDIKDQMDQKFL